MKNKIIGFIMMVLLANTLLSQSTWTSMPGLSGILYDLHFFNNQTGWVAASNGVYNTTNGGINWVQQTPGSFLSISFIDANTGIAARTTDPYRTTDGGTTWNPFTALSGNVLDICFTDNQNGFAVGSSGSGRIWKTTDAGQNWSLVYTATGSVFQAVHFINPNTGWASGTAGKIAKTTNSGINWINQNNDTYNFNDIWFVNENVGWVSYNGYYVLKSTNGGTTWAPQSLPNQNANNLHFFNEFNGRVVGPGGNIFRTVNGGLNWFAETSTTTQALTGIFFTGNDTGYVCGANGTLLKTVNAGSVTGVQPVSTEIPEKFSLSQNYPNPFNPSTKIRFALPQNSYSKLVIYDVLGKELEILVNQHLIAGTYEFSWNASEYSSGVYFYEFESDLYIDIKKMILTK
ncbi:MAG: T9SS type A sorting domain-containing protein [Ignavibacteria bacterium]|nr:T9SS type A sorting domain-containing protein [Ignavibacteria bacterium]